MSEPRDEPFIPASRSLPEISAATLLLAVVLSVIMAGANAYLGLFAGMTVSASIPAAVVSMGVLKLVRGNILQNNIVQTAATSGEGVAGGVIFTIPALVLLGTWDRFHYWETAVLAGFGGILGVLFTIPLRRAMIIEQPLRFPEGVATAEVLKAGHEGGTGVAKIAAAAAIGGVFKLGATGLRLWQDTAAIGCGRARRSATPRSAPRRRSSGSATSSGSTSRSWSSPADWPTGSSPSRSTRR